MEREIIPTFISIAICPQISKMTVSKIFFHRLTAGRKYALTKKEYQILTDPEDAQMFIFYQYLKYIIYRRKIPCTSYHFKYMNCMLTQIENRVKKIETEEQKVKKITKQKNI